MFNGREHRLSISRGVQLYLTTRRPVTLADISNITDGMDRIKDILDARLAARRKENSK